MAPESGLLANTAHGLQSCLEEGKRLAWDQTGLLLDQGSLLCRSGYNRESWKLASLCGERPPWLLQEESRSC